MPRRPGGGSGWPQVTDRCHVKKNTGDITIEKKQNYIVYEGGYFQNLYVLSQFWYIWYTSGISDFKSYDCSEFK